MKKLFLFLITIGFSQSINAFTLISYNVSPINTSDLNVNVKVAHFDTFEFISSTYTVNGNIIVIDVCCRDTNFIQTTELENDYIIPNINTGNTNYTITVNLHEFSFTIPCENTPIADSGTMQFTTPVTQPVYYLSNATFNNKSKIVVAPNPNNGSFYIDAIENCTITVYDLLGKVVYTSTNTNNTNYFETYLLKGIYLLKIEVDSNNIIKKLVVE